MQSLDVAIIGGGPAGLAAALALRKASPGLRVKVFERSAVTAPRGAGLSLEVNGLKALRALCPDVYASVAASAIAAGGTTTVCDPAGNVLRTFTANADAEQAEHGLRQLLLGWWELTCALQRHLPAEAVVGGTTFERAIQGPDHVDIYFKGEPEPVRSRLLVGCDGLRSKVWQAALGLPPSTFQELVIWRARVRQAALPPSLCSPAGPESTFYMGGGLVGVVYPIAGGDVVWTVSVPSPELEAAGLGHVVQYHRTGTGTGAGAAAVDGDQRIQHCLRMVAGYPALLLECIAATDPASVLEHGLWIRDPGDVPDGALGDGHITVLGDAFHPMRPTGQGLNTSLEDAVVLGACIAEHGPCAAALRAYERERIPRVKAIMATTMAAGRKAYTGDARAVYPEMGLDLKAADWRDLGELAAQRTQRSWQLAGAGAT